MKRKFTPTRYPAPDMRPPPTLGEADAKRGKFTPKGETGRDGSKRDVPQPLTKALRLSPEMKVVTGLIDELVNDVFELRSQIHAEGMVQQTQTRNELAALKARVAALEVAKLRTRTMVTRFHRDRTGKADSAESVSEYHYEGE